jgi:vacuolar protein sorting-associated protein 13A/C
MEGEEGLRKSSPFTVEDISISEGGVNSTPLAWDDGSLSGFFAYRRLVTPYQSEVHVVPEFVVFNGSEHHRVVVRQPGRADIHLDPGKIAPLRTMSQETAIVSVEYPQLGGRTPPLRIDSLGLRVAVVKSRDGSPIGSFALQTVVGAQDSRLVVKLGDIKYGTLRSPDEDSSNSFGTLKDDFFRFRIRWSELQLELDEARPIVGKQQAYFETALDRIKESASPDKPGDNRFNAKLLSPGESPSDDTWVKARERHSEERVDRPLSEKQDAVCTILLYRFTIDWQRVFKEVDPSQPRPAREALQSPERSQLSIIVHNVQIRDDTPNSPYPIVFDSTSSQVNFFDLCIRFRGPLDADLV